MSSSKTTILDVRPLLAKGEEPYAAIRARVDRLEAGAGFTLIAPFLPAPLIERLRGEGFSARVQQRDERTWVVDFLRE
ncbi:MAG: DUF2249 domain-containing protein [Opitutaceae bacterium]|nr:DUF2249 domain-containing protein [Opitutaceae bacterium]